MNLKARREEMCADFEDKGEAAVQDALLHGDMSGTKVHLAKVWLEEQKEARHRAEALEVEEKRLDAEQEREARESERRAQDGAERKRDRADGRSRHWTTAVLAGGSLLVRGVSSFLCKRPFDQRGTVAPGIYILRVSVAGDACARTENRLISVAYWSPTDG